MLIYFIFLFMHKIFNGFLFHQGTTHLLASRRTPLNKNGLLRDLALKNIERYDNNELIHKFLCFISPTP